MGLYVVHFMILHTKYHYKAISTKIPDPTLNQIVKTIMIHGPCEPLNSNSPCRQSKLNKAE